MKTTLLTIGMMLLGITQAQANGQEGRGGRAVFCDGKDPVMLDYYHATIPTLGGPAPKLVDISKMKASEVISLFYKRLSTTPAALDFGAALKENGPLSTWLSADLRNIDDSGEPYFLPQGCKFRQAAVRQDSVLYGDPSVVGILSPAQQGMLIVHEALYRMAADQGFQSSSKVRDLVRVMLKKELNLTELQASLTAMKQRARLVDLLSQAIYNYASYPNRVGAQFTTMTTYPTATVSAALYIFNAPRSASFDCSAGLGDRCAQWDGNKFCQIKDFNPIEDSIIVDCSPKQIVPIKLIRQK